jgi:hypothetical protein
MSFSFTAQRSSIFSPSECVSFSISSTDRLISASLVFLFLLELSDCFLHIGKFPPKNHVGPDIETREQLACLKAPRRNVEVDHYFSWPVIADQFANLLGNGVLEATGNIDGCAIPYGVDEVSPASPIVS